MSEWLVSIAGTPEGARLATYLALFSAVAHAAFGALQKGRHDPWMTRGAVDVWLGIILAPIALFLVPWPTQTTAIILVGVVIIHFAYKVTMAMAYERAAYTVVYPVVRGTGPVVTVIAATLFFNEHFTIVQWLGVACVSGGILLLALRNLSEETLDPHMLKMGLAWALAGGFLVAIYTTYDAYGIRQSPDPFTFLAWFFFVTAFDMPLIAVWRYRRMVAPPDLGPLMQRGFWGALIAMLSFGGIMLATRLDKVGEAAVLRETSTVFAALIGWFILGEKVGPRRLFLMSLVAIGAVIVEMGAKYCIFGWCQVVLAVNRAYEHKPINPILKQVLELGPTLIFFLIYLRIKDETYTLGGIEYSGFIVATLIFVPILLIAMGILWALTKTLSRMQLFTAFMVIFFGGLTAYFNDERFFKMKTSIVYGCFAVILGIGLLRGRSYLEWVMGDFLPMQQEGWMILTKRITVMFIALAIANELIWRTQSTELWVKLETFAFPAVLFVFLWMQIVGLQRFLIEPDAEN